MSWLNKCYSRLLIDNHITDISPDYMSKFSPEEYVRMVETAKVDSAMVYACCHNGNCYYPTQVGHMHKNLKSRDIFGEVIHLLNEKSIVPIAYYTVVFHNDSALSNPKWQMKDVNGNNGTGRYRFSCINNLNYVEFAKQQIAEILEYDIAGVEEIDCDGHNLFDDYPLRDYILSEADDFITITSKKYRLTHSCIAGEVYNELFDLENDPHEYNNVYEDESYEFTKLEMLNILAENNHHHKLKEVLFD